MSVYNIIERVQSIFPNVGTTMILKEVDRVQKKFCAETKILKGRGLLESISTNTAWELPSDFEELYDVTYYNSDNKPLYEQDYNDSYKWEIEFGKIYVYSLSSTSITGLASGINACYIHYYKAPTAINDTTDDLSIPYEFDEAIEAKVMQRFYTLFSKDADKWSAIQYFESVWRSGIKDAKAKRNNWDKQGFDLQAYDYAGRVEMPRRTDADTTSVSTLSAINSIYDKYVRFTVVGTTVTKDTINGFTYPNNVTATATIDGVVTISSPDGEFDNSFYVISNNRDNNIAAFSTTIITLDFFGAIGTVVIEVYKKK